MQDNKPLRKLLGWVLLIVGVFTMASVITFQLSNPGLTQTQILFERLWYIVFGGAFLIAGVKLIGD